MAGNESMDRGVNGGSEVNCSFESTTSWFLNSVNDFCSKSRPKLVDYTPSDASFCESSDFSAARTPVSLNVCSLPMLSSSIEHYAGRLCVQAVMPDTKFGLLWPYTAGGIGPVATAGGTALLSHQAPAQHCTALPSMVSHYIVRINSANTSYATDAAQPHEDLWKSDLWEHLQNVRGSSFARSIKRKQEREADQALCAAMDSMRGV